MGELQMNSKWTKLAAAGALSLCTAVPALAGSVTQPGETVGLNAGTPLAPGWYAINTVDWGCMEHLPAAHMCGSHHSGCRLVNAVDDFGRESTVAGGVAWGGSRRATQPTLRSRHLLYRYVPKCCHTCARRMALIHHANCRTFPRGVPGFFVNSCSDVAAETHRGWA